MTLSALQKAGIALSILWAISAFIYTQRDYQQRADKFSTWAYETCITTKELNRDKDLTSCDAEKANSLRIWTEGSDKNAMFVALAPLPFAWFAAFVLLYIFRIQIAGFRAVVPWPTMSKVKRVVVVGCGLATLGTITALALVVMNLYVDKEVPLSLALKARVFVTDAWVTAKGTWTRTEGLGLKGEGLAFPIQTSEIVCSKLNRQCVEAKAMVSGNTLISEVVIYEVTGWTKSAIHMKNEHLCAIEVFTIDLLTETVTGAGKRINADQAYCKTKTQVAKEWSYRLADGFPIYWQLRQEARPMPLRVLHSVFGN